MKQIFFFLILASVLSCSKNTPVLDTSDQLDAAPQITYDTTAIDSFGPGATSESVMAKINAVAIKREKDSLAAIAKAEQEKLDKEKAEKEKIKKEEDNKSKTDKINEEKSAEETKID
ncbi:MAG: hypothetical protein E2590_05105 [Chryseobacterium sp.]|nr:hypothetical protein [Chryseobacterium sp.]